VIVKENIADGQRVEGAFVQAHIENNWVTVSRFTVIGYQRIAVFDPVKADGLRVRISACRARPDLYPISVHGSL
jgi:hypothetical protein